MAFANPMSLPSQTHRKTGVRQRRADTRGSLATTLAARPPVAGSFQSGRRLYHPAFGDAPLPSGSLHLPKPARGRCRDHADRVRTARACSQPGAAGAIQRRLLKDRPALQIAAEPV
jgi:hypothetical protein